MIDDVWRRLTNLAEQANAELVRPERWPSAIGYAPWIEEVWTNYLSNAIKYGGDPPRIEIGADVFGVESNGDTPQVRFWVHDNGPGISDAERKQLFQEFSRLDQHSKLQGHGLGLSIVKRILDKLGGTFGVESLPDQGSTFFFTLPMDLESTTHNQISSEKLASH